MIAITIRKQPSHNRKEPGIFSTTSRGPARGSHDRGGYDLLGLSAEQVCSTIQGGSADKKLAQGDVPPLLLKNEESGGPKFAFGFF